MDRKNISRCRRSVYHEPTDARVTLCNGAPEEAVCCGGSWQPWRIKALGRDYPAPAGWRWQGAGSIAYLVRDATFRRERCSTQR